jgi:aspartyl-tRNA(Asn)/glutamyl-tRNA(Gln) amidotransferase subunit A
MPDNSPIFQSATELSASLQAGNISAVELTQEMIDRVQAVDERVHAFLHLDAEDALAQAKASDERRARGKPAVPSTGYQWV